MPLNTRQWAQRKLNSAAGNLDAPMAHLLEVAEKYREQHPEISAPMDQTMQQLLSIQENIEKIRDTF